MVERTIGKRKLVSAWVYGAFYTLLLNAHSVPFAFAGPTGGQVVGGSGSINHAGSTTTINQNTQNMAINWQSYNVNVDERVQYIQPNSSSISLNRILSQNGSTIAGRIDANGRVILVNPNGIFFTPTSVINVGSIIASGLDIQPNDFMNGEYIFNEVLGTDGAVINSGLINASLGGSAGGGNVALIGKQVENEGVIVANLGSVTLAAGKQAVLTFDNIGMLGVRVSDEILQEELGVDPAVVNSGEIQAEGGRVLLTASTSHDVFSQAVNTNGIDQATSVVVHEDGSFTLGGGADVVNTGAIDTSTTNSDQSVGRIVLIAENVTSSGELHADAVDGSGGEIELHSQDTTLLTENSVTSARSDLNGQGGIIKVLGDKVGLFDQSTVDVSGANGGGSALIGGDYQGSNQKIKNAKKTVIGADTSVYADAYHIGDGGKAIIWSDQDTYFFGDISVKGGSYSGNGGLVETSGKQSLLFDGNVDLSAVDGKNGLLLLDPLNINIRSGDDNSGTRDNSELSDTSNPLDLSVYFSEDQSNTFEITANRIELILDSGNVLLEARRDIEINETIDTENNANTGNNVNSLTLLAGDDITVNSDIRIGSGDLLMIAGSASCEGGCATQGDGGGGISGSRNIYLDGEIRTSGSVDLYAADHVIIDEVIGTNAYRPRTVTVRAGDSILINAINNSNLIEPASSSDNGQILSTGNVLLTAADAALQTDVITVPISQINTATTGFTVAPVANSVAGIIEVEGDVTVVNGNFVANTSAGHFDNWWNNQNINVGAGDVTITAGGNIQDGNGVDTGAFLGDITAGSLSVTTTTGQIRQSTDSTRNLVVTGTSLFDSNDNQIDLQNTSNNLQGAISLINTGANSIDLENTATTTFLADVSTGGNLTITASQNLSITDANAGADDVVGAANSVVNLSFGQQDNAGYTFTADGTVVTGAGGSITITGGLGADTFDINVAGLSGISIAGAGGNDTFQAANENNYWLISAPNTGGIYQSTSDRSMPTNERYLFTSVENLVGNNNIDNFLINDGASINVVNGGAGAGANVLIGRSDVPGLWTVSGVNSGNVADNTTPATPVSYVNNFSNIQSLSGGTNVDDFVMANSSSVGTIDGGAGSNSITGRSDVPTLWIVDGANSGSVADNTNAGSPVNYVNNLDNIQTINGGANADTFSVAVDYDGTLNGGAGADVFNLDVDLTGSASGQAGNDVFNITTDQSSIIQGGDDDDTFNINADNITLEINGGGTGTDNDTLAGNDSVTNTNVWSVVANESGTLVNGPAPGTVTFNEIENLNGGSGDDEFTVDAAITSISTDTGINTVIVNAPGNVTGSITGMGTETVTVYGIAGSIVTGNGVDTITVDGTASSLNAGSGNDVLAVATIGSVTGLIDGGADTDELTIGTSSATVRLGIDVDGVENLIAAVGTNTLVGAGNGNTWEVSSTLSRVTDNSNGDVTSFSNFTTLNAGAGGDDFDVSANGITAINGNIGDDDIVLDVAGRVATVNGGNGTDSLTISTGNNEWTVDASDNGSVNVAGSLLPADTTNFTSIETRIASGGGNDTINLAGVPVVMLGNYQNFGIILGDGAGALQGIDGQQNDWSVQQVDDGTGSLTDGINDGTVLTGGITTRFIDFSSLIGGNDTDNFTITNTGTLTGTILGNGGTNELIAATTVSNTWDVSANNTGNVVYTRIGDAASTQTNFNGIQNLTGSTGTDTFALSGGIVDGLIDGDGGISDEMTISVGGDQIIELGDRVNGNLNVYRVETITANVNTTNEIISNSSATVNNWNLTGTRNGTVEDGLTTTIRFNNFDRLTGAAGTTVDNFTVSSATGFAGLINGGSGTATDTLIITALGDRAIELGDRINGNLNVFQIETITARVDATNELIGDGNTTTNTWSLNGTRSGTVSDGTTVTTFSNIDTASGGASDDNFTMTADFAGLISGGGGNNDTLLITAGGNRTVELGDRSNANTNVYLMEDVTGNATTTNTILSDSTAALNTWQVDGDDSGNIDDGTITTNFTNFTILQGGNSVDDITLAAGNTVSSIDAGAGADQLTINGTVATVDGGLDDDTIAINGNVTTMNAGSGGDQISVSGTLTTLNADAGSDDIFINNGSNVTTIDAGAGSDNIFLSEMVSGLVSGGGGNNDTVTINAVANIDTVEIGNRVTGNLNIDQIDTVTDNSGATDTTLIADNSVGGNTWSLNGDNSGSISGTTSVAYFGFENLTGGDTNDTFNLSGLGVVSGLIDGSAGGTDTLNISITGDQTIEIGNRVNTNINVYNLENINANVAYNNTLIGDSVPNPNATPMAPVDYDWIINGNNSGSVRYTFDNQTTNFTNFANLVGGSAVDQFTVASGSVSTINMGLGDDFFTISGGMAGTVNGNDGDDTFTNSGGTVGSMNGNNGTDFIVFTENNVNVTVGVNIGSFEGVTAANGQGTINAQAGVTSDWLIDGVNSGSVTDSTNEDLAFSGFTTINGGSGVDNFDVTGDGSVTTINGGASNDTLDLIMLSTRIQGGTVNFDGGAGNNTVTITGDASVYTETYTASTGGYDQLMFANGGVVFTANYQGVSSITDNLFVDNLVINAPADNNNTIVFGFDNLSGNDTFGAGTAIDVAYTANSKNSITVNAAGRVAVNIASDVNIPGTFRVNNATQVSETGGAIINANTLVLDNTTAGVSGDGLDSDVANLSIINSTGNVYIDELNGVTLTELSGTSGNVVIATAIGSIDSTAALQYGGNLNLVAANDINLTSNQNTLTGLLTLTANNIVVNNNASTNLGDITSQNLTLISDGGIIDSGVISSTGVAQFTSNTGGIVLDSSTNNFSELSLTTSSGNNATVVEADGIYINNVSVGGTLDIDSNNGLAANDPLIGDMELGVISANVIELNAGQGAMTHRGSDLTATMITLSAAEGIGGGGNVYNDTNGYLNIDPSGAINTTTPRISAINTTNGTVNINNSGSLEVDALRNNGDIILTNNTGDITFNVIGGVGAIDATYNPITGNPDNPGSVAIRSNSSNSIYTTGAGIAEADITADNLLVQSVFDFGTRPRPIRIDVDNNFTLFASRGAVYYYGGRPTIVNTPEDLALLVVEAITGLSGQQLIDLETLGEVDPAIFTEVRNYNYDDIAILLPADQRYTDEEEEEKKKEQLVQ